MHIVRRLRKLPPPCLVLNRQGKTTRLASTKASEPLRILFCGSDDFSSTSLRALHSLQQMEPHLIKSIDVICRPPKRTGRGLKHLREVPASLTAKELGLPLHHVDTFRGWSPPTYENSEVGNRAASINLVVAVSFGLLVPPRILNNAKYGGLNVHPSLLPDFRGAAPIEHTLLERCTRTGVTLQTLHPSKMDHGLILSQWPADGIEIPQPDTIRPAELKDLLAPLGATMLVDGIRRSLHIAPYKDLTPELDAVGWSGLRKAPKIHPDDRRVRWDEWSAEEILRRQRILGPLWNNVKIKDQEVRITFFAGFSRCKLHLETSFIAPGVPFCSPLDCDKPSLLFCKTLDGHTLSVDRIKVPGYGEQAASIWARKMHLFGLKSALEIQQKAHDGLSVASCKLE